MKGEIAEVGLPRNDILFKVNEHEEYCIRSEEATWN